MTYLAPIRLPAEAGGFDLTMDGDSLVVAIPSTRSLAVIGVSPGTAAARLPNA